MTNDKWTISGDLLISADKLYTAPVVPKCQYCGQKCDADLMADCTQYGHSSMCAACHESSYKPCSSCTKCNTDECHICTWCPDCCECACCEECGSKTDDAHGGHWDDNAEYYYCTSHPSKDGVAGKEVVVGKRDTTIGSVVVLANGAKFTRRAAVDKSKLPVPFNNYDHLGELWAEYRNERIAEMDKEQTKIMATHGGAAFQLFWPELRRTPQIKIAALAAAFYLLEGMSVGVAGIDHLSADEMTATLKKVNKGIMAEASLLQRDIVTDIDPVLYEYCDMAVGGELRHMVDMVDSDRGKAWCFWKVIRRKHKAEALRSAQDLFCCSNRSGFGGALWANVAAVVEMREADLLPPKLFCDRVFNLQHNGGVVLNKITWGDQPQVITDSVGPAHAAEQVRWTDLIRLAGPVLDVEYLTSYRDKTQDFTSKVFTEALTNVIDGPPPPKQFNPGDLTITGTFVSTEWKLVVPTEQKVSAF